MEVFDIHAFPDGLIQLIISGGNNNNRDFFVLFIKPQLITDIITVDLRHHDIETDKVRKFLMVNRHGFPPIGGGKSLVAFIAKDFRKTVSDVRIVFGDQDLHSKRL